MIFQPDAFASHSYLQGQEIGRRCRIGLWRRMNRKTCGAKQQQVAPSGGKITKLYNVHVSAGEGACRAAATLADITKFSISLIWQVRLHANCVNCVILTHFI
jgi:hypothetical protein